MNACKLTNKEIAQAVTDALITKKWSVVDCCVAYNDLFLKEIDENAVIEMKKDFVHRVKKNHFAVVNKRVLHLCDFLDIDLYTRQTSSFILGDEIEIIEQVIRKNPTIGIKIKNLLKNVAEIAEAS